MMTTSTPANASSPANISPVGPPPAITTACSVIAAPRRTPHRTGTATSRRATARLTWRVPAGVSYALVRPWEHCDVIGKRESPVSLAAGDLLQYAYLCEIANQRRRAG